MAAQPHRQTPPPQQQYPLQQGRARKTVPMASQPPDIHQYPLTTRTPFRILERCDACGGAGSSGAKVMQCPVCPRQYTYGDLRTDHGVRHYFRTTILPCSHAIRTDAIRYVDEPCGPCHGTGWQLATASLGELAALLFDLFQQEFHISNDPGSTTDEFRAWRDEERARLWASQPTEHTPQAQPHQPSYHTSEPTAPNARPTNDYFTPHLKPLAPERQSGEEF